ncbi:MAG: PstS family phosphate ABC transporter substrate-binding protein [Planctomycetota bacterium]|jgi:phosphate transport system substrate-binding protein
MTISKRIVGAAAVALGLFLASGPVQAQPLRGKVSIDGSSTVYPITEAVAEEFGYEQRRVRVTVGISGTGGGMKRFSAGETDISDASRPIKGAEYDACTNGGVSFIEIPVAYDGLSIVVNKANTWVTDLTVNELRAIFLDGSTVKTWQDVRSNWPAEPIKFYSPGTDSGTFDYFKEVIVGKTEKSIRSDMSVSEDDNVLVRGVSGSKGAIGFFGFAYYIENKDKLRAVPVNGGNGPVMPTTQTIESGEYAPFSRPLFIYVNAKSADRPEVDAFVGFYFEHGAELAEEVGYVRLPQAVTDRAMANFKNRRVGTQFLDASGEKKTGALTDIYK